jgi:hypothetical protein
MSSVCARYSPQQADTGSWSAKIQVPVGSQYCSLALMSQQPRPHTMQCPIKWEGGGALLSVTSFLYLVKGGCMFLRKSWDRSTQLDGAS